MQPATVLRLLAVALVLPLFGFAGYLWMLGRSVVRCQMFPPSGVRMIGKTVALTGEAAVGRGRLLQAIALILAVAALVLGGLLWRLDFLLRA
jgi:hypothetical protein